MKPTILIADDDVAVRESVGRALESEQFAIRLAGDGREALEAFFEGRLDLVLLDLAMPEKNGWETFERMTAYNPYLPIILITARPDQYELAVAARATALMEKPLDLPWLIETIHCLLDEPAETRARRLCRHQTLQLTPQS